VGNPSTGGQRQVAASSKPSWVERPSLPLPLPKCKICILNRQLRQGWWTVAESLVECCSSWRRLPWPAIGDDVMHGQEHDMLLSLSRSRVPRSSDPRVRSKGWLNLGCHLFDLGFLLDWPYLLRSTTGRLKLGGAMICTVGLLRPESECARFHDAWWFRWGSALGRRGWVCLWGETGSTRYKGISGCNWWRTHNFPEPKIKATHQIFLELIALVWHSSPSASVQFKQGALFWRKSSNSFSKIIHNDSPKKLSAKYWLAFLTLSNLFKWYNLH